MNTPQRSRWPVAICRPLMNHSNAVGLAVPHIENTGGIDEHSVRPREGASKRIGLWAIPPLTRAEHGRDDAGLDLDPANDVVFCVGDIQFPT